MSLYNSSALKNKMASFFSRFFLSESESNELKKLVCESDAIYKRLDEQEYSIREMNKINAELNNAVRKEIKGVWKKTLQVQMLLEKSFDSIISELKFDIAGYTTQSKQFHHAAACRVDDAAGKIAGVNGAITGIRDYLEENSKISKRFQEGYDYHVLKNFVRHIARTIGNLDGAISKQSNDDVKEELIDARDDLVELLSFNGVEQIIPEVGGSRHGLEKYVEVVQERVACDNPELSGKIAEIVQVGYKFAVNEDQDRIILPARVKLFV
jgi:molecular chaperone GrpE (heat shock protein)